MALIQQQVDVECRLDALRDRLARVRAGTIWFENEKDLLGEITNLEGRMADIERALSEGEPL